MQLRVKPSAWITTSGLSPDWTRSTARIRISSRVLWSRARASRRFMSHCTICLLTYELVNIGAHQSCRDGGVGYTSEFDLDEHTDRRDDPHRKEDRKRHVWGN